ncbi:MAG: dihydrofolate reductase family protein [Acidimicrobiales bacterium]
MARLSYTAIVSLDGYVEDRHGDFSWATPDEQVHALANDLTRPLGTHLLGRRMYETMLYWEGVSSESDDPPVAREFAEIWQRADKVVYSTTLAAPASARTRLERDFNVDDVRAFVDRAELDVAVAGATLAAHAIRAGAVDDFHLIVVPVMIGGGRRALPDDAWVDLTLVEVRRFDSGVVYLHYTTAR